MSRYVDYKKLKERVGIMAIVEHYSWDLQQKQKKGTDLVYYTGDCPVCGDGREDSTKFKVTPAHDDVPDAWNCFGDCRGGNILNLVSEVEDVSIQQASILIAEWFDVSDCDVDRPARQRGRGSPKKDPECAPAVSMATESDYVDDDSEPCVEEEESVWRQNPLLPFSKLKGIDPNHEEVGKRGLTDVCRYFEAGFFPGKGMMQGRLAIPIHDISGDLVAYCGIDLETKEIKFPPPDKYERGLELFNMHRAVEAPYFELDGLIIVEDIRDAMFMHTAGYEHTVATMGGFLSANHIELLRALESPTRQLTVLWSEINDDVNRMVAKLAKFAWVRVSELPKAITKLAPAEIKTLVA